MRFVGAHESFGGRRRHRRLPWRTEWLRGRVVKAGAIAVLVATLSWLWLDGWYGRQIAAVGDGLYALSAQAGLRIEDVLAEGRQRTPRAALLASLDVVRGMPILAFDPHEAKARLETLPWVREAIVERRMPDTIYLHLTERQPLALWQVEGELSLIDSDGHVLPGAEVNAFTALPLLVGADAPRHAGALLAILNSEPDLRARVAAAIRVQGRRWNIRLDDGIDVRLPETDAAGAWAALARLQREHAVLQRDVVAIDLRYPDRLVVRSAPGIAPLPSRRPAGEDA